MAYKILLSPNGKVLRDSNGKILIWAEGAVAFIEDCKVRAREFVNERESVLGDSK